MNAAIYVHIPFCARKCAYCDFESHAPAPAFARDIARAYIDRVLAEAREALGTYGRLGVGTLFIGGGTPSFIDANEILRLISGLRALFDIDARAEISVEANPGTLSARKLDIYRAAGVNRLSLGAQAMKQSLLDTLGRIHAWSDVVSAVSMARAVGFDNINLDLMYALPGQTADDWTETLSAAIALKPEHMALYSLILEPGTPLSARVSAGELAPIDEDAALDMAHLALDTLARAGFARYEISNFARPGCECKHNLIYWTRGDYLGLGCAAHSLMNGARFYNPGYEAYMRADARAAPEILTRRARIEEHIMLETRLTRGLDMVSFRARFGDGETDALIERARALAEGGFLTIEGGYMKLTRRGLDLQNAVLAELF